MKNIKQLQSIANETDTEIGGIDYQNRQQAIEIAIAKLQNQPNFLHEIVKDAINERARHNVARIIDEMVLR